MTTSRWHFDPVWRSEPTFVLGVELRHELLLAGLLVAGLHGGCGLVGLHGLVGLLLLLADAVASERRLDLGCRLLDLGVLEVDV